MRGAINNQNNQHWLNLIFDSDLLIHKLHISMLFCTSIFCCWSTLGLKMFYSRTNSSWVLFKRECLLNVALNEPKTIRVVFPPIWNWSQINQCSSTADWFKINSKKPLQFSLTLSAGPIISLLLKHTINPGQTMTLESRASAGEKKQGKKE